MFMLYKAIYLHKTKSLRKRFFLNKPIGLIETDKSFIFKNVNVESSSRLLYIWINNTSFVCINRRYLKGYVYD